MVFPDSHHQHSAGLQEQNSGLEEAEEKGLGGDGAGGSSTV